VPGSGTLFADRSDAGRVLAQVLRAESDVDAVVVGLARGGVLVAVEVARALRLPLDVVAVRKVGHPWQPEYALGAVAPGGAVYLREMGGLGENEIASLVVAAQTEAVELDRRLHLAHEVIRLEDRPCLLVDDGLATGATMIAAVRWARDRGATRVVAAAPFGARQSANEVRREADAVVCPHELADLIAVGLWYRSFGQVGDAEVADALD
jgi:putative phosphoribosyl transferase